MVKLAQTLFIGSVLVWNGVQAQSNDDDAEGHFYLGLGATSLALDNDRLPGISTSSPGHASKTVDLLAGYQFNDRWAADFRMGTEFDNADVDVFAVNGYRYFGSSRWRPSVSAGLSAYSLDDRATDDSTTQAQIGLGISGDLNRNLELRVGYQSAFALSGESYQDNEYGVYLVWHFRKPKVVAAAEPQPAAMPPQKEVIQTYELQVQFDFDKSDIKSAYEPQFQEIAQVLRENPDISLVVEGHTCWIGTEKYNLGLSQRRADAVKQKFVQQYGIEPSRIDPKGYGESRPVADNTTLEGRRQNRRAIAITLGPDNVSQ